jgi:hypothetical protein
MGVRRKFAILGAAATAAVAAAVVSTGPARADTVIDAVYPISGTTHVNATDSDMTLGPGTLSSAIDLSRTPLSITGSVSLPPSTGSFNEIGIVPVTATVAFVPVGQTTGSLVSGALTDGEISATSQFTLRITGLKVAGVDVLPGDDCETATPATITVTSPADFNATIGGTLTGTYTIPDFKSCGPLGLETPVINAVIPGPGNTISLTLGTPALSAG